jgi:hypothetical protein
MQKAMDDTTVHVVRRQHMIDKQEKELDSLQNPIEALL